jgi:hypothetical protein
MAWVSEQVQKTLTSVQKKEQAKEVSAEVRGQVEEEVPASFSQKN